MHGEDVLKNWKELIYPQHIHKKESRKKRYHYSCIRLQISAKSSSIKQFVFHPSVNAFCSWQKFLKELLLKIENQMAAFPAGVQTNVQALSRQATVSGFAKQLARVIRSVEGKVLSSIMLDGEETRVKDTLEQWKKSLSKMDVRFFAIGS